MNGVKGPLYGHQTDDKDSLSDTNKPKEDQGKWGLNRKVKKLKSQVKYLNHPLNQEKYRQKLEKIRQNLKTKKRKFGKKERKKAPSTKK